MWLCAQSRPSFLSFPRMSLLSSPSSLARAFTRTPLFVTLAKTVSRKTILRTGARGHPALATPGTYELTSNTFTVSPPAHVLADNWGNNGSLDDDLCRALLSRHRGLDAAFGQRGLRVVVV